MYIQNYEKEKEGGGGGGGSGVRAVWLQTDLWKLKRF